MAAVVANIGGRKIIMNTTGNKRLWQMVLVQAVVDAIVTADYSYFEPVSRRYKDFLIVCSLAEIDHRYVQKRLADKSRLLKVKQIMKINRIKRGVDEKITEDNTGEYLTYFTTLFGD